jgi:hypothetical protein
MSDPTVTVVITCFNYARYLPESVGSVLAQTLSDFEVLIVDDGSTDESLAVARELAAGDERITVIAQPNSGQPAIPRNRAVGQARGRYIVSLDADDRLGSTMLEACAAVLDADPAVGMAYPQQHEFGHDELLHPVFPWSVERLARCNFLSCTTMYRRAAWEAAGGYHLNVRGYEDWDLWLGIAEAGYVGRPAPGALFHYRKHEGGVYDEAKGGDQRLKAQVLLNRPGLFGDAQLTWARGVLAGDPGALAIGRSVSFVPALPEPPRPLTIAHDRTQRADWYLMTDELDSPWPARTLTEALALVDRLGATVVWADGAVAAVKRAADPVAFPIPFFTAATTGDRRAALLAEAAEQLVVATALRAPGSFDAERTADFVGVPAEALGDLLTMAQTLIERPAPVPVADAAPLARLAGVLRSERTAAGDTGGAARAAVLQEAARRAGLEEARSVAILAFGAELIADPSLLAAYGAAFSGEDDVTLVIVTADAAPLLDAVAAAGLDGDGSPDMMAVDAPPPGVDAVFSRHEHDDLPRFDTATVAALRTLAVSPR